MKKKRIVIMILVSLLVLGGLLAFSQTRIAQGVSLGGLDIGDRKVSEAYEALKQASKTMLEVTAQLPEETLVLTPAETGVRLKTGSALWAAWQVGRFGTQTVELGLLPHLKLDKAALENAIAAYGDTYDTVLTPSSYVLQGEQPDLGRENEDVSCQTLTLTLGLPTAKLDREDALNRILAAYNMAFTGENTVEGFQVVILEEPEAPDLEAIYQAVYIPPVNDGLDLETYQEVPGAWGYGFDTAGAEKLVSGGEYGETISIPMELVLPEIYGDKVYFRDVLGFCETKHTDDENRNNNLRKACEAMNGLILQPGEVFSYNDTLGPRTKENGYLRAGAYSGWELVQSYGGGICQGSTTIYGAALQADLEIVQRVNHGYKVGYVEPGLDATVSWNGPDFQFKNSTHFPIQIIAEVSEGYVRVTILGTEERDYYVEMESEVTWGQMAIYAKSYKCKYDRQTGALISRELEARSNYAL